MAATAVLKVYEDTAKRIEEMGKEVRERVALLAQAMQEAKADLEELGVAATNIRDKGSRVAELVRNAAAASKLVREAVADFTDKVKEVG
jgi:methyl-accepting chemotaxis protein